MSYNPFQTVLDENHLKPGTKLKKGDEELKVVKAMGDDHYIVKEEDLDEAVSYKQTHTEWGVVPKSKQEFVKFFDKSKEAEARAHAEKTGGTLKKIDQMKRAIKEEGELVEAKVGDSVWVKHPTDKWKTLTGRVKAIHSNDQVTITHRDGSIKTYPKTSVSTDYESLHANPYKKPAASESTDIHEKTLTPAELKKREEIAKAMERDKPGMDKSKKMAIATAVAKRVAESVVAREKDGRKFVSAEVAIKLARELAAKRKPGEKATHADLQDAQRRLTREETEQIDEIDMLGMRGQLSTDPKSKQHLGLKTDAGKAARAKRNVPDLKYAIKMALSRHPKATLPEEVEQVDEITGNQHKLDVDKDGKLEKSDFAKLRDKKSKPGA